MKSKRVDIKRILNDPVLYRKLMINCIIAIQTREGVVTTEEQATRAFDKVSKRKFPKKEIKE